MVHAYASDPAQTARRIVAYDEYMGANVLSTSGDFMCSSGRDCWRAARAANSGCAFYEGQLGYIGEHYDLAVDGVPWRMLFVGMELSGTSMVGNEPPRRVSRETRSAHHNLAIPRDSPTRNPHMKGVLLALRYAAGLGLDTTSEQVPIAGSDPVHLLRCYALINARLCSATKRAGGRESAGVARMTANCSTHLRATISILQPTLVVIQGRPLWPEIKASLPTTTPVVDGLPLESARIDHTGVLFAHFSHPRATSYQWTEPSDTYLNRVVLPTLRAAVGVARSGGR